MRCLPTSRLLSFVLLLVSTVASTCTADAATLPSLRSTVVASGLSFPLALVQDPIDPTVQFVVEQFGRVRIIRNGVLLPDDFLNLAGQIAAGGESGLLGLAFAPDYASSRRLFVNFTNPSGHTVIARYRRSASDPLRVDPTTRFDLLWPGGNRFIVQPFSNHNGGDLHFGSDGYLYIAMGDGGSGNDPGHRAQDPQTLLGKMIRVDVNVPDSDPEGYNVPADNPFVGNAAVLPEIWAFGFRNPFRFSVDAIARGGNGAILIGDVGQSAWEEIDYEPFGAGGRNYGWRNREGAHDNVTSLPPAFLPLVDPIVEYDRSVGTTVIGGVVYRGTDLGIPFFGRYFFADFGSGRVWSVRLTVDVSTGTATATERTDHTAELGGSPGNISAVGVDASCRLHLLDWSGGRVLRIEPATASAAAQCATPDPFLALGGGVFVDGGWLTRDHPTVVAALADSGSGGTGGGTTAGCVGSAPVAGWLCVNGGWVPADHPAAAGATGSSAGSGGSTGSTGGTSGTGSTPVPCVGSPPGAGWVCANGGWVPADHPAALTAGSTGGSTGGTTDGTGTSGGSVTCVGPPPGANWVCVAGGAWVPPDHPLARGGGS